MGAWGPDAFENDEALDWAYELTESTEASNIKSALETVVNSEGDYLESPKCCMALAAAEIVAALVGHSSAKLPDNVKSWVTEDRSINGAALLPLARKAVKTVRSNSELKELWDDSPEAERWYFSLDDLSGRLGIPHP